MSLFLTHQELIELTDLRQHSAQRRWLDRFEWIYEVGIDGRPKVARKYFERRMVEQSQVETGQTPPTRYEVNVAALRG